MDLANLALFAGCFEPFSQSAVAIFYTIATFLGMLVPTIYTVYVLIRFRSKKLDDRRKTTMKFAWGVSWLSVVLAAIGALTASNEIMGTACSAYAVKNPLSTQFSTAGLWVAGLNAPMLTAFSLRGRFKEIARTIRSLSRVKKMLIVVAALVMLLAVLFILS